MSEEDILKDIIESVQFAEFNDLVYMDSEDLMAVTGLAINDDGNLYDPLEKDLDNDGISDRYDHDFKDSDYLESTFDIDGSAKEQKPSILEQIRELKESKSSEKQEKEQKDNDRER